jgi:hypothetical protein
LAIAASNAAAKLRLARPSLVFNSTALNDQASPPDRIVI